MSNKKIGTKFEKQTAEALSDMGFWVYKLPDKINGQPFDILALKNDAVIALDCKVCLNDIFYKNRIEPNQHMAMERLIKCSPKAKVGFYFLFSDSAKIFVSYEEILKTDKKSIKKELLLKIGEDLLEDKNL